MSVDSASDHHRRCFSGKPEQDSCWSWVVCLACAASNSLVCGIVNSYGIIFPFLLEEFQQGKALTALAGSIAMVGNGLFSPIVVKVYHRVGPLKTTIIGLCICCGALLLTSQGPNMHLILLTYGVLFGFGSCFVFFPPYLVIPLCFVKRRAFALGLLATGPGAGLFIMSPILEALLVGYHWRKTYTILAGIMAVALPFLCTLGHIPEQDDEQMLDQVDQKETRCKRMCSTLKNKRFVIIMVSMYAYYAVHYIPLVHMARYCEEVGMPASKASRLYLYSGLTSLIIRPVIGRLCDIKGIDACFIYQLAGAINGVATLLLPLATKYFHFILYLVVWGFADGATGCSVCVAIIGCFSDKQRATALGISFSVICVIAAAGPALGGLMADELGSYVPVFYMTGVILLVGSAVIFLLPFFKPENVRHATKSDERLLVVEKCTVV